MRIYCIGKSEVATGAATGAMTWQQRYLEHIFAEQRTKESAFARKYCKSCKSHLPRRAFYQNRNVSDGLSANCSECSKKYGKRKRAAEKEWRHIRPRISLEEFSKIKTTIPDASDVPLPRFSGTSV